MNSITQQLEEFIKKHERFRGSPMSPFQKALLRKFADTITLDSLNPNLEVSAASLKAGDQIAFITENVGHTTGGRYYAWFIATALTELGYDVITRAMKH